MKIAKTRQQIADEYGVCRKTFYNWCKRNGIYLSGGLINPKEQEIIYKTFGNPRKTTNSCPDITHNYSKIHK